MVCARAAWSSSGFRYVLLGEALCSGSGFRSWKAVLMVPVSHSALAKTVLMVPVSGSDLIPAHIVMGANMEICGWKIHPRILCQDSETNSAELRMHNDSALERSCGLRLQLLHPVERDRVSEVQTTTRHARGVWDGGVTGPFGGWVAATSLRHTRNCGKSHTLDV